MPFSPTFPKAWPQNLWPNWRARAAPQQKASAMRPVVALQSAGRPAWTPCDAAALARVGYCANVVAFRAIRMVAEGAAAVPLSLRLDGEPAAHQALLALLGRPNPRQTGQELLECVYGYLQTAGDAYIEMVRGPSGKIAELHALRPDRMRVVPDQSGWPSAYEYRVGRAVRRFETPLEGPHAILHLRSFHPLDDHYGMSPMQAAARAVDVHAAAAAWSKALLDNAARPSGAVVYSGGEGHLSEEQHQRLVDELETHHQGARNAGRPMLLEGGLDWKPMGFSPADMEFAKTKDSAAREIALAFGVPPMLLGLPGDNTYSNYQEANRAFARETLLPLVRKTAGAIAAWLAPELAPDAQAVELSPDLDATPALAAERDARWRRIAEAEFLSDDEKRTLLGFEAAS